MFCHVPLYNRIVDTCLQQLTQLFHELLAEIDRILFVYRSEFFLKLGLWGNATVTVELC